LIAACGGGGASTPGPPVVVATTSVTQGQAPLTVAFDATKSTDPQNYTLTYSWSFGDGSTATGPTPSHNFETHGTYSATVTVDDGHDSVTSSPLQIVVTAAPPSVQAQPLSVNVLGVSPTSTQSTMTVSDRENLPLQFSISTPPMLGSATINASTGVYSYTVPGFTTAGSDAFKVTVSNGLTSSTGTVTVTLNGDPLLPNQWHIQNTGQNAFASNLPLSGQDLNVAGAWESGYSGKGIKVGVVDSGLEAAHEDLAANVDLAHSYNFVTGGNDPTPATGSIGFDHGTAVAGIIGAVAFNGKGGRGVAYNASLRGYNLIASFSVANMAAALGGAAPSADNDLFNASFGAVGNAIPTFSSAFQNITLTTMNMRGGLGAAIVNAAGNDFQDFESGSSSLCQVSRQYGVSCGDPATDERRGGYAPIIVGALSAAGVHASYSTTGSSLWISAPGGEYGLNSAYYAGASSYDPAIITTSRDGCANAIYPPAQYPNGVNPLDANGVNPFAANCQYTAVMNGTSSATPNTSGTVAMMLEANPKLSVRDIKYILAKTAKQVDPTFAGVSSTSIISGSTIVLEQGWVANGAGYSFSNRYGFGGVDAAAAVAMAKTYTSYLPAVQNSTGNYQFYAAAPATIPARSAAGSYIKYTVSEAFPTVEFVVVFVNVDSTPGLLCNQIELSSPSGTKSILLHAANGFTNAQIVNSRFESNAFYGEPINGTWTLRFLDFCAPSGTATVLSSTQPQTLLFAGH
jgi:subtilisin family serine protease